MEAKQGIHSLASWFASQVLIQSEAYLPDGRVSISKHTAETLELRILDLVDLLAKWYSSKWLFYAR